MQGAAWEGTRSSSFEEIFQKGKCPLGVISWWETEAAGR